MISKAGLGLSVLMLGLGLVGATRAEEPAKTINAATISYYPPYAFKDLKSGELQGFDIDLFNALAEKLGANVNWSEASWPDLASLAPLKTKRVDIYAVTPFNDIPRRRELGVSFVDFAYEARYFFALSTNANQFKSPQGLCGKRVAVPRSSKGHGMHLTIERWSHDNCTKAGNPAVVLVYSESIATILLEMKQGRVDASVNSGGSLDYQNQTEGNAYIKIGNPLYKPMGGLAFLNENMQLGLALKNALDGLIADGTYVQLLRKWKISVDDTAIGEASINAGPDPAEH